LKYRLMDLLACPICKKFPLKLFIFSKNAVDRNINEQKPLCELYCSYMDKKVSEIQNPPCEECIRYEIVEGLLYCDNCKRWYPIIDEIPRMLPDNLRRKEDELKFLSKHKHELPKVIIEEGLPFNLKS